MRWPIRPCASASPLSAWKSLRVNSRRLRPWRHSRRPTSTSGGRSSKLRAYARSDGVPRKPDREETMQRRWMTVALLVAGIQAAAAQTFPSKPITLIVPFAAGGPTDSMARAISERMRVALGQPVVIENVTGAAGTIGVTRAVRSPPDGYTISMGHLGTHVVNGAIYPLPYDLINDLEPLILLGANPMLITSKNAVPAKTLAELIAWLKANQDKATMGTAGVGSGAHFSSVYFQS